MYQKISVKRAELLYEWLSAIYANDTRYYESTLALGIPDGNTPDMVLADLQCGEYDDDIDELLAVYRKARKLYGGAGYYYSGNGPDGAPLRYGKLFMDSRQCLAFAGYKLPDRLVDGKNYRIRKRTTKRR